MIICLLSVSKIADDPRVRRHGDALHAAGYDICAVGLPGAQMPAPSWQVTEMAPTSAGLWYQAFRAMQLAAVGVAPGLADTVFRASHVSRELYEAARGINADIYHANDWLTLPVAACLANENGARFVYDSHEYAVEEGADRWSWRLLFPRYIRALEQAWIGRAEAVFTVSEGIADLLRDDYGLTKRPNVLRNAAAYEEYPFRPCGDPIEVLYQGAFREDRGLETLIGSVHLWRPEFRLTLRGFGPQSITERLQSLANGVEGGRVRVLPPCAPSEMIRHAGKADIGVHPIPPISSQTRFCLPNKFFEYVMAGLALCISDAPEMAGLLRAHDLGRVIETPTPEGTAAAINGFTPESINHYKRNALKAARILSWDSMRDELIRVYEDLNDHPRGGEN